MMEISKIIEYMKDNPKEIIKSFPEAVEYASSINRHIYLGDIDEEVGGIVDNLIRFWNKEDEDNDIAIEEREPIKIFINSGGGDLFATFTMVNSIAMSKTPVWTINTGAAYSGGFLTFIAGHKRFAYPYSSFLLHEGSLTGMSGDAGKFRNFAAFYEKSLQILRRIVIDYTDISQEEYNAHKLEDWWFTAEEAKEYGIFDEYATKHIF